METIKGIVDKVIFKNEENGFKVLKVKMSKGPILSIVGEFGPDIIKGTEAEFHGDYKSHPKYGYNFRVNTYTITHNQEQKQSLELFLADAAFNIGVIRARAIVKFFKEDVVKIFDEEPNRLLEVPGIGEELAKGLQKAWQEKRQEWFDNRKQYDLRAFLNNLGIKEKRIKKIIAHFGLFDTEKAIRENPYVLTEIEGFGFSTADHIARQLGIPLSDPFRLKAFILYLINVICPANGHLYLSYNEIANFINKYCEENETYFINKNHLSIEDILDPLNALKTSKNIEDDKSYVYSNKCYLFETVSVSRLVQIMSTPSDLLFIKPEDVQAHLEEYERDNKISLSDEQKLALKLFAEEKVFIITGSPGSGKTSVLKVIVSLIKKRGLRLTCMTPTGISAKKMAETIEYDAYTIHRRLGFKGDSWDYNEKNKYDTDVIIVDEVSMLDQEVFYRLLSAIKDRVHIIMVGDHNQLPSVGAGNVLRELLNCGMIPTVKLEKIFRQSEASGIIKVAHQIKDGNSSLEFFSNDPKSDVFFYRENNIQKIEQVIIKLAQKFKEEKKVKFQIISPKNQGPLSVDALNKLLQEVLNPPAENLPERICHGFVLRKGDRIKVKKNDYMNEIYNGDIGKISDISSEFVEIIIDDRTIKLSVEDVEEKIKLAYIISTHSSQGLEYPYIILPFINQYGKMLLQRNLLYTAITRAKQKVIIMGHGSAIEKAINNACAYKRNTKLGMRIIECFQLKKDGFLPGLLEVQQNFQDVQTIKEQSLSKAEEYVVMDSTEN